jgi:hypothetical protein
VQLIATAIILNNAHPLAYLTHTSALTAERMAGSCGGELVGSSGISLTFKSLMSLARKMINSYTSLLGGICLAACLPSVPKDRTIGEEEEKRREKSK